MKTKQLLLSKLAQVSSPLPSNEIILVLKTLDLNEIEVAKYFRPNTNQYHREYILQTPFLELIAITWLPGQASAIHNHAESTCGVRVLTGDAAETLFAKVGDDEAIRIGTTVMKTGKVFGGESPDNIHIIANDGVIPLHTIHLYSPPLAQMRTFCERI